MLTQEQIQQYRTKYNIGVDKKQDIGIAENKIQQLRAGKYKPMDIKDISAPAQPDITEQQPKGFKEKIVSAMPEPLQKISKYGEKVGEFQKETLKEVGKGFLSSLVGASSVGERMLRGGLKAILPKSLEEKFGVADKMDTTSAEQLIPEEIRTKGEGAPATIGFGGEQLTELVMPFTKISKVPKTVSALNKFFNIGKNAISQAVEFAGKRAIQTGGDIKETKQAAKIGFIVPPATAAVGYVLKGIATPVSNFLFGVKGTTGFGVRYKDPSGVEKFLVTARRKGDGKNVEDIVSVLDKSINSVKNISVKAFVKAENAIKDKIFSKKEVANSLLNLMKKAIDETKLTATSIKQSGLSDTEVNLVIKAFRIIKQQGKFTTKSLVIMRRRIDALWRGRQATAKSDRVMAILRKNINDFVGKGNEKFRQASKQFSEDKKFLEKLGVNIVGKSKANVEQTANKLFSLAKQIDDPFRGEATEKLLLELEKRTGLPVLDTLRALATAVNLSPQQSQGIRAGVIREFARILEVGVSGVVGALSKTKGKGEEVFKRIPSAVGIKSFE